MGIAKEFWIQNNSHAGLEESALAKPSEMKPIPEGNPEIQGFNAFNIDYTGKSFFGSARGSFWLNDFFISAKSNII